MEIEDIAYLGLDTNIAALKSYLVQSLPCVSKAHWAEVCFKSSRYWGLIAKAISSSDASLGSATDDTFTSRSPKHSAPIDLAISWTVNFISILFDKNL